MKEGQKIYVISIDDLDDLYVQDENGNDLYPAADELTDEQVIELSQGWCFDTVEDLVDAFNQHSWRYLVPSEHYLRII